MMAPINSKKQKKNKEEKLSYSPDKIQV